MGEHTNYRGRNNFSLAGLASENSKQVFVAFGEVINSSVMKESLYLW
jgi:hypothetical protein